MVSLLLRKSSCLTVHYKMIMIILVSGSSFYPSPACQESKRTGNYSTLCISKPSSSVDKSSQGIFFISVDPCTMPISYWAVALFPNKNNTQVIRQFTASKIDSFVPVGELVYI